jgi:hypothetical protein
MLLFQKRFHEGLVRGDVTLTFRAWDKPKVKPKGRYRCHPIGVLEVDEIDRVTLDEITEPEAKASGFADREELLGYLQSFADLGPKDPVYRVRLHHAGDGDRTPVALDDQLDAAARRVLRERLRKMDERSPHGPWTRKTLKLIERMPRVRAGDLADALRREKLDFKADVVKLKKLGLTQSFEIGYELTPRGRAYLAGAKKKKPT